MTPPSPIGSLLIYGRNMAVKFVIRVAEYCVFVFGDRVVLVIWTPKRGSAHAYLYFFSTWLGNFSQLASQSNVRFALTSATTAIPPGRLGILAEYVSKIVTRGGPMAPYKYLFKGIRNR